jgi:acetylornithine/succinyldiaminopimelate/putrescine aminotransferase
MGFEERKQVFRPLIPDVDFITFNNEADFEKITTKNSRSIRNHSRWWIYSTQYNDFKKNKKTLYRSRCLMILDEIQPDLDEQEPFGFQNYDVVPRCSYGERNGWRYARRRIYCFSE